MSEKPPAPTGERRDSGNVDNLAKSLASLDAEQLLQLSWTPRSGRETLRRRCMRSWTISSMQRAFVYPGHGLVQLLSDGLGPTLYDDPASLDELKTQIHNRRRARFIAARGAGPFYVVDCDIASFLYIAIGEVLRYPIHLVEIPTHNFVRWVVDSHTYVDFETMDGEVVTDTYYRSGWGIPEAFASQGDVLATMNRSALEAYHDDLVAIARSWRGGIDQMLQLYRRSAALDAHRALPLNNLAWFYAAVPRTELRNTKKAILYARRAAGIFPDGDTLDTLACAYAQGGDFRTAIATEEKAALVHYAPFDSDIEGDDALFKKSPPKACLDTGFGKDPQPFRPPHPGTSPRR
jgi:hypothetical protein